MRQERSDSREIELKKMQSFLTIMPSTTISFWQNVLIMLKENSGILRFCVKFLAEESVFQIKKETIKMGDKGASQHLLVDTGNCRSVWLDERHELKKLSVQNQTSRSSGNNVPLRFALRFDFRESFTVIVAVFVVVPRCP
jgi:hypothetical protein